MRRTALIIAMLATASIAGCGGSPPSTVIKPPPGGGAMIRLPGNRGLFTIKSDGPPGPAGRGKKSPARSVVATFFQADGVTPMSPAPTDVVLQLESAGKTTSVALAADPKDPTRFASTSGPYPQALQGTVRLKIDGQDVEESFSAL
jgi:hypothetical protein